MDLVPTTDGQGAFYVCWLLNLDGDVRAIIMRRIFASSVLDGLNTCMACRRFWLEHFLLCSKAREQVQWHLCGNSNNSQTVLGGILPAHGSWSWTICLGTPTLWDNIVVGICTPTSSMLSMERLCGFRPAMGSCREWVHAWGLSLSTGMLVRLAAPGREQDLRDDFPCGHMVRLFHPTPPKASASAFYREVTIIWIWSADPTGDAKQGMLGFKIEGFQGVLACWGFPATNIYRPFLMAPIPPIDAKQGMPITQTGNLHDGKGCIENLFGSLDYGPIYLQSGSLEPGPIFLQGHKTAIRLLVPYIKPRFSSIITPRDDVGIDTALQPYGPLESYFSGNASLILGLIEDLQHACKHLPSTQALGPTIRDALYALNMIYIAYDINCNGSSPPCNAIMPRLFTRGVAPYGCTIRNQVHIDGILIPSICCYKMDIIFKELVDEGYLWPSMLNTVTHSSYYMTEVPRQLLDIQCD